MNWEDGREYVGPGAAEGSISTSGLESGMAFLSDVTVSHGEAIPDHFGRREGETPISALKV